MLAGVDTDCRGTGRVDPCAVCGELRSTAGLRNDSGASGLGRVVAVGLSNENCLCGVYRGVGFMADVTTLCFETESESVSVTSEGDCEDEKGRELATNLT